MLKEEDIQIGFKFEKVDKYFGQPLVRTYEVVSEFYINTDNIKTVINNITDYNKRLQIHVIIDEHHGCAVDNDIRIPHLQYCTLIWTKQDVLDIINADLKFMPEYRQYKLFK